MSGFLQRLLARASGEAPGPKVRLQPPPAWMGDAGDLGAEGTAPRITPAHTRDDTPAAALPPLPSAASAPAVPRWPAADAGLAQAGWRADNEGARRATDRHRHVHDALRSLSAEHVGAAMSRPAELTQLQRTPQVATPPASAAAGTARMQPAAISAARPQPLLPPTQPDSSSEGGTLMPPQATASARKNAPMPALGVMHPTPESVVHVTIGRIDLVAQAPPPRARPAARAAGTVPLSDYLRAGTRDRR